MIESPNPQSDGALPRTPPPQQHPRRSGPGLFLPFLLIVVGVVLLLHTLDLVPLHSWWRLWILWPGILILLGVDILVRRLPWLIRLLALLLVLALFAAAAVYLVGPAAAPTQGPSQSASWPMEGLRQGEATLTMGAGQVEVSPLGDSANWAEAELQGPARSPLFRQTGQVARLELAQDEATVWTPGSWNTESLWSLRVNPRVPLALTVRVGAGEAELDLNRLTVTDLQVDMGVGRVQVLLPAGGETGKASVRIRAGVGSVRLVLPEGMAVQVRARTGIGRVDAGGTLVSQGDGTYRTPGYGDATWQLDVEVDVGIGDVTIR